ncbi:cell death abnormality protein 1 [Drosophila virilis]|uniref:EGF-like domain-containing protein n=1 Tax=Drosophila virilis TaxID=7244 RepID=A0A0Q9W697_DROVI|nr:cell death abnormality protein 1 [Drosophila virilis]KRF77815.1 uncharacterized protein Dvir_GJ25628 [Drosophila virilis]
MDSTRGAIFFICLIAATGCTPAMQKNNKNPYNNTCLKKNFERDSDMENISELVSEYECCPGYVGAIDDCKPVCSVECDSNKYCSAPEHCECVEGFKMVLNGDCHPACTEGYEMQPTGECVSRAETKEIEVKPSEDCYVEDPCLPKDPNLCTREVPVTGEQQPGYYTLKEEFEKLNIPFPNILFTRIERYCCDGYGKQTDDELCQPVCQPNCGANAYCKAPNKCACQENYHMGVEGQCVENFKAVDPHVCSKNVSTTEVKIYCCDGYEQNALGALCLPKCSQGCGRNCRCVQPEVCECEEADAHCLCKPGYAKGKSGHCEPLCAAGCPVHSSCLSYGLCQCLEGYTNSTGSCQPNCLAMPENSKCVRPGEWECDLGYIKLPDANGQSYTCQPHCRQSCSTYGKCVEPNVCECLPGFKAILLGQDPETKQFVEECRPVELTDSLPYPYERYTTEASNDQILPHKTEKISFRTL